MDRATKSSPNPKARARHCRLACSWRRPARLVGWKSAATWRISLSLLLLLALVFSAGCKKNKPVAPPAPAPALTAPPAPQVEQQPAPPVQTTSPPATDAQTGAIPQPSTTSKPKPRNNSAHKTAPQQPKPVQPEPEKPATPASENDSQQMQIAAQAPEGTAQNTEQLLQTSEANLRKVNRQLSDSEQAMMRQARNYITQSRLASHDGDLERAYNLAIKANLLAGELAK